MKNLEEITNPNRVYSEELNEILIKTPPTLFRNALIVFLVCIFCVLIGGTTIEYEKSDSVEYVLTKTIDNQFRLTFFSKKDYTPYLKGSPISVYPMGYNENKDNEVIIQVDSFQVEDNYKNDDESIQLSSSNIDNLTDLQNLERYFKVSLYFSNEEIDKEERKFILGNVKIGLGHTKLYNLVL